ncbi:MAG TPA: alpha/beta fold hydrolase [Frankiaceae bacterium]|nr:alpha/beta fold hydrolase [Frankiaceae bacterium]
MAERRVLLHGALGSAGQLAGLGALLGGDVVRVDLPGHGARPPERHALETFVHAARDALGDGGDLVGYSLGGYVALATAAAHPEAVGRVVTIATKLAWTPALAAAEAARLDLARPTERAPAFVDSLTAAHPGSSAREVLGSTASFIGMLGTAPPLPLDEVRCPVLVVVGADDHLVTLAECEDAVARLPQGRLVVLPGTGHAYERMPVDALAEVIRPFLD